MSKAAYWQRGEAIDFTNESEKVIEAGAILPFGDRIGVAGTDIAPGETGSLHVEGVFEFPKGEEAIEAGAEVCLDITTMLLKMEALAVSSANGTYNSTVKDRIHAGYAIQEAKADAETVFVKINA